ncbi:PREDICTED: RING finger protein nhl-1-like [Branchiostoma belcheri]|uniref:RING finger protein nhl-1-like n=1 Tax=Branchiostoma belcheri TaxID=7741 RepID=A0A6P4YJ85_BRABE|nr:PREDICTED: RING finger protein nhl-1-like [Branchiostoma belcheri]
MAKGGDVKPEKITFGGQGKEPGKFRIKGYGFGVAVSADNEIFVTDRDNKRVQVFSMNGTYLRLFPTVVPGESMAMFPFSVTLDVGPGYLWVLGRGHYEKWWSKVGYEGHVVQYSKNGQPIKKFDVSLWSVFHHVIAMDVRNNKVIVGDGSRITMFDPNGSSSKVRTDHGIGGVISDKEGNILLTNGDETVLKYTQSGVKIFQFGTYGKAKGQLDSPQGICLDSSGHIIVANRENHRVDMFTSTGEFVRTIVEIKGPWGVAMGPCRELVVTSSYTETVTIIPRHMVHP